jgi:hypothetical protein
MDRGRRAVIAASTGILGTLLARIQDAFGGQRDGAGGDGTAPDLAPGAHGSDFQLHHRGTSPSTVALGTTARSGSSLVVCQFGDLTKIHAPTDNKGNEFTLLLSSGYHAGAWKPFGMRMYAKTAAAGGPAHVVSMAKDTATDESTLVAIEVKGGATIRDKSVVARAAAGAGMPSASGSIVTTGPALLLALWGGDGDVDLTDQRATPEKGWTVIESRFLGRTAYIQAALAWKRVDTAGPQACTWLPAQRQGAILAMVAIQA